MKKQLNMIKKNYLLVLGGVGLSVVAFSACAGNLTNQKAIAAKSAGLSLATGQLILHYPMNESGNINGNYCDNSANTNATLRIFSFSQMITVMYPTCHVAAQGICQCELPIKQFEPGKYSDAQLTYRVGQKSSDFRSYKIHFLENASNIYGVDIQDGSSDLKAGSGVTVTPES